MIDEIRWEAGTARLERRLRFWGAIMLVVGLLLAVCSAAAQAQEIPRAAVKYRADLTRTARASWGLDAPVAVFAAQIHQESGWNPTAVSRVGATGMAQFMPATAQWWCALHGLGAADCQPSNPVWAMRALVGYDRWLFERVRGNSEADRLWAALRSYNGGLGHWQKEAALVRPALDRQTVDSACGKASRHVSHCPENLGYQCLAWGVETVQFQEFMYTELLKRAALLGIAFPGIPMPENVEKDLRIISLQPHFSNGKIRLHRSQTVMIEQTKFWPEADHDDGPDCLEKLWKLANQFAGEWLYTAAGTSRMNQRNTGRTGFTGGFSEEWDDDDD